MHAKAEEDVLEEFLSYSGSLEKQILKMRRKSVHEILLSERSMIAFFILIPDKKMFDENESKILKFEVSEIEFLEGKR